MQDVRVFCEDLLKIILRPEAYEVTGDTLGKLRELITTLRTNHIGPYNRPVFKKLIDALNEKSNKPVALMNQAHHEFDGTLGLAEATKVQDYWESKLQKLFDHAFRLAADFDAYSGESRLFPWTEKVVEFPASQSDKIQTLKFHKTGIAAAAKSDGRIGDGEITIHEWEDSPVVTLYNHDAYQLTASTLDPVAAVGDIILVRNHGAPNPRNLVVAAHGDRLLVRRFNDTEDHPDLALLTGQATDPYSLPEPIIALKDKIELRKIVGTVFMPTDMAGPPPSHEAGVLEDLSPLLTRVEDARLFEVKGRSMEPIALDGQFVMTHAETIDGTTLMSLDSQLVIAIDDAGAKYFKRLRRHGGLVVLESINSDSTTSSEILSLESGGDFPTLVGLMSVIGVLFELPPEN